MASDHASDHHGDDVRSELTADFIDAFADADESYDGGFAAIVATGILPVGVNLDNPRVREIVARCRAVRSRRRAAAAMEGGGAEG